MFSRAYITQVSESLFEKWLRDLGQELDLLLESSSPFVSWDYRRAVWQTHTFYACTLLCRNACDNAGHPTPWPWHAAHIKMLLQSKKSSSIMTCIILPIWFLCHTLTALRGRQAGQPHPLESRTWPSIPHRRWDVQQYFLLANDKKAKLGRQKVLEPEN